MIFAQMVDDPSEYVDVLLSDPAVKRAAQRALKKHLGEMPVGRAPGVLSGPVDRQALGDMAAELERERLFRLLEDGDAGPPSHAPGRRTRSFRPPNTVPSFSMRRKRFWVHSGLPALLRGFHVSSASCMYFNACSSWKHAVHFIDRR